MGVNICLKILNKMIFFYKVKYIVNYVLGYV